MSTTIILVRHGQTDWNRVERFRGRYDVPLNQTGLQQASGTAKWIKAHWKPAAVYSSPMSRAVQTAEQIASTCSLSVIPVNGLIDIDYGEWQGLTPDEAREKWPDLISNWYEHPETVQIPGGEALIQVRNRAMHSLSEICRLHDDQEVVLVSHTVVNRLILLGVLGLENHQFWNIRQEPCAINVIETQAEKFIIHSINCTAHLE